MQDIWRPAWSSGFKNWGQYRSRKNPSHRGVPSAEGCITSEAIYWVDELGTTVFDADLRSSSEDLGRVHQAKG